VVRWYVLYLRASRTYCTEYQIQYISLSPRVHDFLSCFPFMLAQICISHFSSTSPFSFHPLSSSPTHLSISSSPPMATTRIKIASHAHRVTAQQPPPQKHPIITEVYPKLGSVHPVGTFYQPCLFLPLPWFSCSRSRLRRAAAVKTARIGAFVVHTSPPKQI